MVIYQYRYFYKIVLLIIFIFSSFVFEINCTNRYKRTLIFPEPSSKIQMIYGIGTPVAIEDTSITFGHVIKANYFLPVNISQILHPEQTIGPEEGTERKKRTVYTRWNIYKILATFLQRYGGKSCVLRSICEISSYNLDKNIGFFEEIFHVIFRPSTTEEMLSDAMDREYIAAEKIGKTCSTDCSFIYSECTFSLIDFLTIIR